MYEHYEYISIEGLDELVVAFKVDDAFLSQADGSSIFYDGYQIRQKIRKQLPPNLEVVRQGKKANRTNDENQESEPPIDSDNFRENVKDLETTQKVALFFLLCWSFVTGNRNLDFIWSYLGVLQIISHMALLKIQVPINTMLMCKAMVSVSILDIKEVQNTLFGGSFMDVGVHLSNLLNIIEQPITHYTNTNIED